MEKYYICEARNNQGCVVRYYGTTEEEALAKFDAEYYRKGFDICILDQYGDWLRNIRTVRIIKNIVKRNKNRGNQ